MPKLASKIKKLSVSPADSLPPTVVIECEDGTFHFQELSDALWLPMPRSIGAQIMATEPEFVAPHRLATEVPGEMPVTVIRAADQPPTAKGNGQ